MTTRQIAILIVYACIMWWMLASCVKMSYYNDSGEMDAEIVIRPSEEAVQDTIDSGEITPGVSAEISIPIAID